MKTYIDNYLLVLGKKKSQMPLMFVFFILASSLDLLGLSLVGPLVYSIISPENFNEKFSYSIIPDYFLILSHPTKVVIMGSILIFVYYLKAISGFLIHRKIVSFSLNHQAYLINKLVFSYQMMPYSELMQRNTSSFYNTISNHVRLYAEQTLLASLILFSQLTIFIVIISFLVVTNLYALSILIILISTFFLLYDLTLKKTFQKSGRITLNAIDDILRTTKEAIGSIKEVRILKKEGFFINKVKKASALFAYHGSLAQALQQIPRYLLEAVIVNFIVVLAIYSTYTNQDIAETIAVLGIFGVGALRLLPSIYQSMNAVACIRFTKHHLYELSDDMRSIGNLDKKKISKPLNLQSFKFEKLEINSLSYKYPLTSRNVLEDVNLKIKKGDFLGIIGESGSGKTTLIDIILGLLTSENNTNNIYLNSEPLSDQIDKWHSIIAYIPQNIFLIDDTIKNNITLEEDENKVSDNQFNVAMLTSQLEETIKNLPEGVYTNVGDDGIKLSGGQRQRIILARAIYHQKEFIIFDEATSSLDSSTEGSIMKDIYKFKGDKTVIIISHKVDILNNCDKIINISDGKISYEENFSKNKK